MRPAGSTAKAGKGGALVTGGAVRLGAAIVERLAREGFDVAIHCNRSAQEADALAERLRNEYGVATCVIQHQLADDDLHRLIERAVEGLGRPLNVLVNSASVYQGDAARDFSPSSFDLHMDVNVRAPLLLSQAFVEQAPEGSSIINLLDQRVLRTTPTYFSYTLSKNALYTATRMMAQAFAPKVRVNGVGPGLTLVNPSQDKAEFERRISKLPLQRGGSPEEIADVVSFLISAPSITGQILAVDGGQHLAWQTPEATVD